MGRNKPLGKKLRLSKIGKVSDAPRWADIRKFGLKRARSRRIAVTKKKHWRRGKYKV